MVQRYDDVGYGVFDMGPDPEGEWVKYEDYAALHALMCRLTDQINICELPEGLYNELEFAGLI